MSHKQRQFLCSSENEEELEDDNNFIQADKCIVFIKQLLQLFSKCPKCWLECQVAYYFEGTNITINQQCDDCPYIRTWQSQPKLPNGMSAGNIALSAAILFTGASPTAVIKLLNHYHCSSISYSSFLDHQRSYLFPIITKQWETQKNELIATLSDRPVDLAGDGRADSPGHCAKYGTYTLMDTSTNMVLQVHVVQVSNITHLINLWSLIEPIVIKSP